MGWYLSTQGVHRYFIPEDYVFAPGTIELEEKNYPATARIESHLKQEYSYTREDTRCDPTSKM